LQLLDTCRAAIENSRFDIAGSLLRDLLLPSDFDETIQQEFGNRRLANASKSSREAQLRRLRYLTRGPWAGIVTTNYDSLIETALAEQILGGNSMESIDDDAAGFQQREVAIVQGDDSRIGTILARPPAGGFFVKIHGSISGVDVVLSTEDYGRTYLGSPRTTSFLTALMLRYHLVFVGCSLEDELVRLRRKLASEFARVIPAAYALLPATETNRQRANWLRDSAMIECIMYPAVDHDHHAVEGFLEEAASCTDWALHRGSRAAITKRLSDLNISERVSAVGETNVLLLALIARQPDRSISHADLVELGRLHADKADALLYRLTPDERVYRVLFLVSVGLIGEDVDHIGSPTYRIHNAVMRAITAISTRMLSKSGRKRRSRSS
jgi:hypothetical protein